MPSKQSTSKSTHHQGKSAEPDDDPLDDSIQAAIARLGGMRSHGASSQAFHTAQKEANAGLKAGSSVVRNVVASMKRKKGSQGKVKTIRTSVAGGVGSKSKPFMVQAVVVYTDAMISERNDQNELIVRGVDPIRNRGTALALTKLGKAALDVELDACWSAQEVKMKLEELFPSFFRYLSGLKERTDRSPHWALCYLHKRKLKVWSDPEPTGADLLEAKATRSGRPVSESFIHIIARESIARDVIEIWHLAPYEFHVDSSVEANSEDELEDDPKGKGKGKERVRGGKASREKRPLVIEDSDEEGRTVAEMGRGKKRVRRILRSKSDSESDDERVPNEAPHTGLSSGDPLTPSRLPSPGPIEPVMPKPGPSNLSEVIELEDTPPPALESSMSTELAGATTHTPSKPSMSTSHWSPSTFDVAPSIRNLWHEELADFNF